MTLLLHLVRRDFSRNKVITSALAIFLILSALSYGVIAFIVMAISLILVVIALLCLSYIVQATLADEHVTIRDIRVQLGIRILFIQVAAILVGTVLCNTLGEGIFGLMLSSMGASRIVLLVEPFAAYLLFPAAQLLAVFLTVIVGTRV